VVQEQALYRALKEGWIKGACLDAQFAYPPSESVPSALGIHKLDNVVLSPHVGGSTWESWHNVLAIAAENINRIGAGEKPMNLVDLDLKY
jgi:phosphoglycerate dehydrogenase-like enzyme